MQLDSTNDRVLGPKGVKHVHSQSMGTREHITVHVCVCANGKVMPPMIIFAKGFPGGPYAREGPNGALYAKSESGYMDGELYLKGFRRYFFVIAHLLGQFSSFKMVTSRTLQPS